MSITTCGEQEQRIADGVRSNPALKKSQQVHDQTNHKGADIMHGMAPKIKRFSMLF